MAGTLPIKNANNLKINSSNSVDKLSNPLNSSVSLNHRRRSKSRGQGKLSAHEAIKPPRSQASKRPEIPLKGEGDSIKRREKQKQRNIE
jgi:hypothetical protein